MTADRYFTEQRRAQRFRVPGLSFSTNSFSSGPIIDLSLGGLSFFYLGKDIDPTGSFNTGHLFGNDIVLNKLPVRIVSDKTIDDKTFVYDLKRYSVQFKELNFRQRYKLEKIIWEILEKKA